MNADQREIRILIAAVLFLAASALSASPVRQDNRQRYIPLPPLPAVYEHGTSIYKVSGDTAISRAGRIAFLIGKASVLFRQAARVNLQKRKTFLKELLQP